MTKLICLWDFDANKEELSRVKEILLPRVNGETQIDGGAGMSAPAVRQKACGAGECGEKPAAELAELEKRLAWAALAHSKVLKADGMDVSSPPTLHAHAIHWGMT